MNDVGQFGATPPATIKPSSHDTVMSKTAVALTACEVMIEPPRDMDACGGGEYSTHVTKEQPGESRHVSRQVLVPLLSTARVQEETSGFRV